MKRINLLDESVFNKIAAGEVVEKPASIVKEFIENSLDAGASEISIEIKNGGIDKIKVVDNGVGIHPDDVKTAFLPHSTSKIKSVDDLSNILTLGFRGEALASIASVTKLKMQTKQNDYDCGKLIEIEGGIVKTFEDTVISNGTIIEVSDLFFNIPARRKFLRKPRTEENDITNLIVRYILANPFIKFTYVVDDEQIYKTNGSGLEDAIYLIYKKNTLENLIKVDYICDGVEISGYISKPTFTKNNRTYQTLIVNNRYVVNSLISTCVQNAYQNMLMKGQFPFYVLNFTLPISSLDVNVHPNKLDVKFENTQKIYGYFYSAISKALLNFDSIKQADESLFKATFVRNENLNITGKSFVENDEILTKNYEKNSENMQKNSEKTQKIDDFFDKNVQNLNNNLKNENSQNTFKSYSENTTSEMRQVLKDYQNLSSNAENLCENPILNKALENSLENLQKTSQNQLKIEEVQIKTQNASNNLLNKEDFEKRALFGEAISTKSQVFEEIIGLNYKIIGTCFDTYIIVEIDNSLFVFDQHACHERLNYDKLVESVKNKTLTLQPLLIPYILETNALETDFVFNNLESLNDLGFQIVEFGKDCFKVTTVPSLLSNISLKDFFKEVLSDLNNLKKLETVDLLKEKLSQKACKASIRAGNKLTNSDIEILLNKMKETNMTLACPHGRPAVIEITKNELEKSFKRKV